MLCRRIFWFSLSVSGVLAVAPGLLFAQGPGQAQVAATRDIQVAASRDIQVAATRGVVVASGRSPVALYRDGISAYQTENYAKAINDLQEFAGTFGNEPELQGQMNLILYALACAYYNTGDYETAVTAFGDYLKKFPDSEWADECHFRIGTSHQMLDRYPEAIAAYQKVVSGFPSSSYTEDSAYQIGFCYLLQDKSAEALRSLKFFMENFPNSAMWGQAGAFAARATFDAGNAAGAIQLLAEIEKKKLSWSVISYCNFLAFEIGDYLFDEGDFLLALQAYRRVKTRDSLLRHQQAYVETLRAQLNAFKGSAARKADPRAAFQQERRMTSDLQQATELAERLAAIPDYDLNLYHRIGRCFFNTDNYWEARVAFARVVSRADDPAIKEAAHFDLILAISRLRRFNDLLIEADAYLATYDPEGEWN